ncbi:hypothetical protein [Desulfomonile tiedjei]|uniref:Uncharacterized protein n=1 Tax=Desulfomonile tiedjei (strain ATCC 49306 / DSM 6799 / DCB-1) TaxID=706587 RepID=I4C6Q3_DESTA|nr:hypothetical protein [Desulfomonile tiedjei]AFM25244.1 hypothetical protein Desti_2564 [Desulfomonile tiedjei DSM 6799]
MQKSTAAKIRTLWFLTAMIPLMMIAGLVGVLSLLLTSPLMVYGGMCKKHIKSPWRKSLMSPR